VMLMLQVVSVPKYQYRNQKSCLWIDGGSRCVPLSGGHVARANVDCSCRCGRPWSTDKDRRAAVFLIVDMIVDD